MEESVFKNCTLYFFPISGLHITNRKIKNKLIFEDATIANGKAIKSFLAENNFLNDKRGFHFHDSLSYILVRIDGIEKNGNEEFLKEKAVERCHQIIALVFFYFFIVFDLKRSVSLMREIFGYHSDSITSYNSNGLRCQYNNYSRGEVVLNPPTPFIYITIEKLFTLLNAKPFDAITRIITQNNNKNIKRIKNKTSEPIIQSLVNFYLTTNIPAATVQLLGSITSIELLLKLGEEKYKNIEKRLNALLGDQLFNRYCKTSNKSKIHTVFDIRHSVIHGAELCSCDDAARSMKLYCNSLLKFSFISKIFYSKDELCNYLDLLYKNEHCDTHRNNVLDIKKHFLKISKGFQFLDWVVYRLAEYFALFKTSNGVVDSSNFIKSIYFLHSIENIELSEAYIKICNCIRVLKIPYKNYHEFYISYINEFPQLISDFDHDEIKNFRNFFS